MNEVPAHIGQAQVDDAVATARTAGVTPELVRQVTDKVYALLLADLKREQERMRVRQRGDRLSGGMERR